MAMKKVPWSKFRPTRPEEDPMLPDLLQLLAQDKRSVFAMADSSGLSTSTIRNWKNYKVRRPQSVSVQMAYAMLGYELRPVKRRAHSKDDSE